MSYRTIEPNVSFSMLEEEVSGYWEANRVFEKSVAQRRNAKDYVFYDGPPFATGLPHYGHILTSYIKDVVPRYFTMQGRHVPRRWGWDCHGLPVEFEVEKDLGLKSKTEVLKYGVHRFNEACRGLVLRYAKEWQNVVKRMGRWVDFDGAYQTMDRDYMESVIWAFHRLHEKGYVYEGRKVVPYCIRCQTVLSNFEARLDDAFRPKQDQAVVVKFPLIGEPSTYLLVWTTTPWTLPANVALAVAKDAQYLLMCNGSESIHLGAEAVHRYAQQLKDFSEVSRCTGKELAGRKYQPPYPFFDNTPNAFVVLEAPFVTTGDGTGIVQLAPAFGEEDEEICQAHGIVGPNPVQDDGRFDDSVPPYRGMNVFDAVPAIIKHLRSSNVLFDASTYEHPYPHCWRCDSPLIYRAVSSWFVRVTAYKEIMLKANAGINWVPEHVKDGRFGEWLRHARDWAVSRSRFWGTPIPVWKCADCGRVEVVGSIGEIEQRSGKPVSDLHRPAIDQHVFACKQCGGSMARVSDVFDCWFESGSMPFAQAHYPFSNREEFESTFPADFIVEYLAQTRGWFYTLVAVSAGLFEETPFRNAVCHGVILGHDGRKMSKRLKNYPDPLDLINVHGSDALRVALLSSPVSTGVDVRFSQNLVRDVVRRFHLLFWNALHFFTTYARIDGFVPTGTLTGATKLDRYLLHETECLRATVQKRMESYDFAKVYSLLEDYLNVLSTWYIKLNKVRIWREELDTDKRVCYETLHAAFSMLTKIMAPFMPFLAEKAYQVLGNDRSVHLEDWPEPSEDWLDRNVADEMSALQRVVHLARFIRDRNRITLKQPLLSIKIGGVAPQVLQDNAPFLMAEMNVKKIDFITDTKGIVEREVRVDAKALARRHKDKVKSVLSAVKAGQYVRTANGNLVVCGIELLPSEYTESLRPAGENKQAAAEAGIVVALDLTIYPELAVEARARELNRRIQELRKRAKLDYTDRIRVSIGRHREVDEVLEKFGDWLKEQVLAIEITRQPLEQHVVSDQVEVGSGRIQCEVGLP